MFHNNNRLTYDNSNLTETDIVNQKHMNYNFYKKDHSTYDVFNIALNQPNINYFINSHVSQNIDKDSELLLDEKQFTLDHDKSTMQEPTFHNKPYLGKGNAKTNLETILRNGDEYRDKKHFTRLNETPNQVYKDVPLLPNVQNSLAKPSNFVEQNSDRHWIRGGLPTRDLAKN